MKILPINSNQNNANFKGTVDKSVVNYLDEMRFDALNKSLSFFCDSNGKIPTTIEYGEVKRIIEGIMSKLNDFMKKTHSKTKILINHHLITRDIRFENTELNSTVLGANSCSLGTEEYGTANDKGTIFLKDPNLKVFEKNGSHTFKELERFDKYIAELTTKFAPEDIDGALFDKKVKEIVEKAEETAPKNRFENRKAFNNLDKLAPKFGREPIYTEQFHIIQALAFKLQQK